MSEQLILHSKRAGGISNELHRNQDTNALHQDLLKNGENDLAAALLNQVAVMHELAKNPEALTMLQKSGVIAEL